MAQGFSLSASFKRIIDAAIEQAARRIVTVLVEDDKMNVVITTFKKTKHMQDDVSVRAAIWDRSNGTKRRKSLGQGYAFVKGETCSAVLITHGNDVPLAKRAAIIAKHQFSRSWEFARQSAEKTGKPVGFSELEFRDDAKKFVKDMAAFKVAKVKAENPFRKMTEAEMIALTEAEEKRIIAEMQAEIDAANLMEVTEQA